MRPILRAFPCQSIGAPNRPAGGSGYSLQTTLAQIERKGEQVLDRIAEPDVPSVISAYENLQATEYTAS